MTITTKQAVGAMIAMEGREREEWDVSQDQSGRLIIRHRHATRSVGAYVSVDGDGRRMVRCNGCGERFELAAETRSDQMASPA